MQDSDAFARFQEDELLRGVMTDTSAVRFNCFHRDST